MSSRRFEVRRNVWVVFIVVPLNKLFFFKGSTLNTWRKGELLQRTLPFLVFL